VIDKDKNWYKFYIHSLESDRKSLAGIVYYVPMEVQVQMLPLVVNDYITYSVLQLCLGIKISIRTKFIPASPWGIINDYSCCNLRQLLLYMIIDSISFLTSSLDEKMDVKPILSHYTGIWEGNGLQDLEDIVWSGDPL